MVVVAHLKEIFYQFKPSVEIVDFESVPNGNINRTFIIHLANQKYILQSINSNVFPDPELVMNNLNAIMTSFIENRVEAFIPPIPTVENSIYHKDQYGVYWRVFPFINHTQITIQNKNLKQVGYAYGRFLLDLSKMDTIKIQPTIPHFHELDFYFKQFNNAVNYDVKKRVQLCAEEIQFLQSNKNLVVTFQKLTIPKRLTHNDAKLDNILFENESLSKWKVIDYDTIMMGYSIFDYGDLIRSTLSLLNSDAVSETQIVIDENLISELKNGFIEGTGNILIDGEIKLLDKGVELILYEQAIRFLSDYINGDTYYRIAFPKQNLIRARKHIWMLKKVVEGGF